MRLTTNRYRAGTGMDAYLSDTALRERMRRLAVSSRSDDEAPLRAPAGAVGSLARFRALCATASDEERFPAFQRAADALGLFEDFCGALRGPWRGRYPAIDGDPRVQRIAQIALRHSDGRLEADRYLSALAAFGEARPLRMAEMDIAPMALKLECLRMFATACDEIGRIFAERLHAERWARGEGRTGESCAFLEHALRCVRGSDDMARREELEAALAAKDGGADGVVTRAHERQALLSLWMENLPVSMRAPDAVRPERFRRISGAEKLLRGDDAYARSDVDSRARFRFLAGQLSKALARTETAVVSRALELARRAESGDPRACAVWYLATDEGRERLASGWAKPVKRLTRLCPDPRGYRYTGAVAVLFLLLFAAFLVSRPGWAAAAAAFIGLWTFSAALVNAVAVHRFPPMRLYRLSLPRVPDDMRTLVVIPALLPSPERACEIVRQLEEMGEAERDANVDFCLLGDFADADSATLPSDAAILDAARKEIGRCNDRAGRERFFLLHRDRSYSDAAGRFLGAERKRGALRALNACLLRGENAFGAEGASVPALCGRYRYAITLDADTRPYPGALRELIGAIAHPLNRGRIALIQPRMALSAREVKSAFVLLMAGSGGVSGYGGGVSDVYQDVCGQGGFAGKGIYDIRAFAAATETAFPDNAILSHDLIEGFLCGAAFADDVVLMDGFPGTLRSYLRRLHRWTRGDWQLLPFFRGRTFLQKYRLFDNLRVGLAPAASLALLLLGLWTANGWTLLAGLLTSFSAAVYAPFRVEVWRRSLAETSLLPNVAFCRLDAIGRAVYRTFVSHKHMLEWVTAADAERQKGRAALTPRVLCAILCAPGLLSPYTALPALLLAALFLCGAPYMESLERPFGGERPTPAQRTYLSALARDTWRFFEEYVPEGGTGFPPDNVQIEPPRGAAGRTSPTNVGLYMASCVAAESLGLISREQMCSRLLRTVESLESAEKWRGQLYNWYDPTTLRPLSPRYVSSVDGGNLAACLLLCAGALRDGDDDGRALSARCEALAEEMDFRSLFDPVRELFRIGYDVERDELSQSHYDLLASESRILSYVAILLGQAPVRHWRRLSRACTRAGNTVAPVSWSGTAFEYLMPGLFLRAPRGTLLREGARGCVQEQMRCAIDGLWGISESGYYSFDARRNYQYRAFGLRALMRREGRTGRVLSPYAAALALEISPREAASALMGLGDIGLAGRCGLYEAADFAEERLPDGARYGLVASWMAHHQGMLLLSVANLLTDGAPRACFERLPAVRAYWPLLEEMPPRRSSLPAERGRHSSESRSVVRPMLRSYCRDGRRGLALPDGHLLSGGGSSLFLTADGEGVWHAGGLRVNRWRADPRLHGDGFFTHMRVNGAGPVVSLTGDSRARFAPGAARYETHTPSLDATLTVCLSPEDGALLRRVTITNRSRMSRDIELRDVAALALCSDAEADEHPAFYDLFLECSFPRPGAMRIIRRPRDRRSRAVALTYTVSGLTGSESVEFCADRYGMLGREASADDGAAVYAEGVLPSLPGAGLRPLEGSRLRLRVAPGETRSIVYAGVLTFEEDDSEAERYAGIDTCLRAEKLAEARARAMCAFLDLRDGAYALCDRASSLCMYARHPHTKPSKPSPGSKASLLWPLGLSGDLPILVNVVRGRRDVSDGMIALHAYLRSMHVDADAVFVYEDETGYVRPARDAVIARVEESHLRDIWNTPGGARVYDRRDMDDMAYHTLLRFSAALFENGEGLDSVLRFAPRDPEALLAAIAPNALAPVALSRGNGYGGFSNDGQSYWIDVLPGRPLPAAWSNILTGPGVGALVTERGGGFFWYRNSRNARLTPFRNDPREEGFGLRLFWETDSGALVPLLPQRPVSAFRVRVTPGESAFHTEYDGLRVETTAFADPTGGEVYWTIELTVTDARSRNGRLRAEMDWLMGVKPGDLRLLRTGFLPGVQWAAGAMNEIGYIALPGSAPAGRGLAATIRVTPGASARAQLAIGTASCEDAIREVARSMDAYAVREAAASYWDDLLSRLRFRCGDSVADALVSRWLPYQSLAGRFRGRAGLYQSGGAYGFRDQLQDALCLLPVDPSIAREHLLTCAAHQFEDGDVQHWWHPERTGVRTRISDDLLFLPYVAACYAKETGDFAVLSEQTPYLRNIPIPDGAHDIYAEADVSEQTESLHEHCMRALRRAASMRGAHGLPLMGGGDWNDGMDLVGAQGRGESVWLGEFLVVVAETYADCCADASEATELRALAADLRGVLDARCWDGEWYLRAYRDDGSALGSRDSLGGCRIDALSQSWAVLAGLRADRSETAMDALWARLFDKELGILRLLDPPFDGSGPETGYIEGYPRGIRENGGQYTHAACWALLAICRLGHADRAWRLFRALLPVSHSDSPEKAERYRVEPYVLAADVYAVGDGYAGRGGWTWYTGAAGWLYRVALHGIAGYERLGDRVRVCALLEDGMEELSVELRVGGSSYTLVSRRDVEQAACDGKPVPDGYVRIVDDGAAHIALFPARRSG